MRKRRVTCPARRAAGRAAGAGRGHADDAAVRESLATGLFNTLERCESGGGPRPARRAAGRVAGAGRGASATTRRSARKLARGLYNTRRPCEGRGGPASSRRAAGRVAGAGRGASATTRRSARNWPAAFTTPAVHAKAEGDLPRRDALLDELRALAEAHPRRRGGPRGTGRRAVQHRIDAKAEERPARRDALLDELRALARAMPRRRGRARAVWPGPDTTR